MNVKTEKRRYLAPELEITKLQETDVIVTSLEVPLTGSSVRESLVDNHAADSSSYWDKSKSPLSGS